MWLTPAKDTKMTREITCPAKMQRECLSQKNLLKNGIKKEHAEMKELV